MAVSEQIQQLFSSSSDRAAEADVGSPMMRAAESCLPPLSPVGPVAAAMPAASMLAPFKSSLSGAALASFVAPPLPFASLRLPAPERPLLERGAPNSSAHLSFVAVDPEASILRPDVLHSMKLQYIRHGCGAELAAASTKPVASRSSADLPPLPPPLREGLRKRKSQRSVRDAEDEDAKRPKALPLVPASSLLTLDKHLSREKSAVPSRSAMELAAFAFARHLVDWASEFDVADDGDSDDEEEQEGVASAVASKALEGGPMVRLDSHVAAAAAAGPSSAFFAPLSPSLSAASSSASTPAFDPEFARDGSARTDALEDEEEALEALPAEPEPMHFSAMLPGGLDAEAYQRLVAPGAAWSPMFAASSQPLLSPGLLPTRGPSGCGVMSFLCLSPLAEPSVSPKASPALLAHLASPSERGDLLPMLSLGAPASAAAHPPALLAHTTTTEGARVQLLNAGGW